MLKASFLESPHILHNCRFPFFFLLAIARDECFLNVSFSKASRLRKEGIEQIVKAFSHKYLKQFQLFFFFLNAILLIQGNYHKSLHKGIFPTLALLRYTRNFQNA